LHLACGADHRFARRDFVVMMKAMRLIVVGTLALAAVVAAPPVRGQEAQGPPKQAVVETTAGTFVLDLAADMAPNFVANFIKTAREGAMERTTFHLVVKFVMVQGGDPLTKDPANQAKYGTGGLNLVKADP